MAARAGERSQGVRPRPRSGGRDARSRWGEALDPGGRTCSPDGRTGAGGRALQILAAILSFKPAQAGQELLCSLGWARPGRAGRRGGRRSPEAELGTDGERLCMGSPCPRSAAEEPGLWTWDLWGALLWGRGGGVQVLQGHRVSAPCALGGCRLPAQLCADKEENPLLS